MDEEEAKVEIHTTVDMLIARLDEHPDEFFNASKLPLLDAKDCLSGCKWRRLVAHLCNPTTTGLFTLDEKRRFSHALDIKMRAALDGQIIKALVGDEPFDLGDKEKENMNASKIFTQGTIGAGTGKNSILTGTMQSPYSSQQLSATAQSIADQHFRLEMERQKRDTDQLQYALAEAAFGSDSSKFKKFFP